MALSSPTKTLAAVCLVSVTMFAVIVFSFAIQPATVSAASGAERAATFPLTYSKDGDLTPPLKYREWTYLTTGFNMSYLPDTGNDMAKFDNVFVNPEACRTFQATGTWPDKTVLVLEGRGAESKGSINKSGHFQSGGVTGLELHVKDESRFPGKWAFFDVENESKATLVPQTASCYSCHADHAAVDTTFVQFYPTLLPIAQKKSTLSASYLKEIAAGQGK